LSTITLLFWRISSLAPSSFRVVGWPERSHQLHAYGHYKHFNPLIHNSICIVPILSTHALMNLSTWYTFCPQEMHHSLLLLLGAILKFRCHVHCFVHTLTLISRSTGLPCQLVTWHLTIPPAPPTFSIFFENIKMWKLFEDLSYIQWLSCILYM
jgi:hypothetical protein